MSKKKAIKITTQALVGLLTNKDVQRVILGTYSDGRTRSVKDCLDGEILSPKQKEKFHYKDKSKKKKKKKDKKKKSVKKIKL